ncbi:MAG: hypothetical protein ACRC62_13785 [Microcoleus sp.]
MPKKNFIPLLLLLAVLFVIYGDTWTFLPQPVRNVSVGGRNFVAGLWPSWLKPKDLNQQREEELERLKNSPSPDRS